jgi:hypothetical protein
MAKHPRVEPIRNPTLFEMDKLEQAGRLVNSLNVERLYSEPGLLLGTSAFTANGWAGAFDPPGMKPHDFHNALRSKIVGQEEGVQETRIVEAAAEILFGDPRAVIKIDCAGVSTLP